MKKIILFAAALLLSHSAINAQAITGTITVPGTYPTLASAIMALNTQSISGNVYVDIAAGYTETATAGGYSLTVSGTIGNSLTFEKSGVGANPQIIAYTGTASPSSALQDGLFRLIGSDYVTIDGIDLFDGNTTNPATMEFGYGFFKASTSDGCQNNTIKNCNIKLSINNNAAGSGPAVDGSRGIDVVNALSGAHTTALSGLTVVGASNSSNKFYNNIIQNCNIGIALIGFADITPFTAADQGNDIGGLSAATSNTIINFGGAAAAANPAAGVRTLNQYGLSVSYNIINNNNGSGVNHVTTLRGIFINSATSANSSINNNTITVSSGASASNLAGIENASGSTAAGNTVNINNNNIVNCNYSTATTGIFNAIVNSGSAAFVNIGSNLINNISLAGTGTSILIETGSPTNASATSNTITNIVRTGASGSFRLLKTTSPTNFVANGNLIDGVQWSNVTSTGSVDGIYSLSSAINVTVTNNVVRNIALPTTGTGNGIRENGVSGTKVIQNNQVYNFTTTAGGAGGTTFNGIFCTTGNLDISNNLVYSLNSTGTSGTGGTIYGIQVSGGTTHNIYKNKIYDLSSSSTGPVVSGVFISGGTLVNIYNNLIGDLRTPLANAAIPLAGINISGGTTVNSYYNSINLSATSSGALFGSAAIYVSTSPNVTLRNNIFVNTSTANGAGITAAYRRTSTTLTTYSSTSNNNLFYAGTPSANNVIFNDGTSSQQTLGAYKALVNPRDIASVTENPPFVSTIGSNANFLNINTSTPTQIESGAAPIAGINDDYAGNTRNATTPDIGAWEGNYTYADLGAPSVLSSGFTTSPCILSGRTFTANISDASGVANGSLAPRVYYKINGGTYTSVAGSLTSGTANNGVWTFNLTYSAASLDLISYFLVAQDVASPSNLGATPSAGFVGTDVNNITTPPSTPNSYLIPVLGGIYTVGSTGTFTSLTQAATAYNQACLISAVTFSLTDAVYSAAETFPIVFNNNPDASSTNSLLIIPASGLAVSVKGSAAASSVFKFLNARYITVDGLNTGGSAITFSNANSGASSVIWLASTSAVGPGNNNIGIRNITAIGGGTTSSSNFGIIAGVDGATPSTTSGLDNDNVNISGNSVIKAYYGIYASGTASLSAGGLDNWVVSGNSIGPVTSGSNNLAGSGIYFQNGPNLNISNNTVRNIYTSVSSIGGIYLAGGVNSLTVNQNTITNIYSSTSSSGVTAINAIYLGSNVINGLISKNSITTIVNTNTGGYGVRGIIVNTGNTTSNDKIQNNMISDIYCYADVSNVYWPIGIDVEGTSGNVSIDYNTISLFGSHTGFSSGATGAAALFVNSTGGAINVRDNILSNTYDNSTSSSDITSALYSAVANTNFGIIDYNDYYVGGTGNVQALGYLGSAQNSIANIQTAFGQNLNSLNIQPVYTTATDLHLIPASNVSLDNFGTPIAGVTTDIDNQTRNASTPDMGADEFTSPVCTTANGGTITATSLTACAGQTLTLTSSGASTGINTVYQWMYSLTSGGTYTNVGGGTGANTTSYTTPTLSPGVYYVVLQAQCTSATLTAISNEATVTVSSNPTIAVSPLSSTICMPGGTAVGLTATGGNSYTWSPSSGITGSGASVNALPVSTTVYTVTGDNLAGCVSKAITTVYISQYPTLNPITATPATVCVGGSSTLQASATLTTYVVTSIPYAAIATPSSGITTLCNNGTASVPLTSGSLDDGYWSNIALPFSFNFFGSTYNTFAAGTNGFIFMGTGNPATSQGYGNALPFTSAVKPVIGAVYSDLDFDGVGSNSTIQYFTVGTSPNQQFVVRWSGQFYNNTGTVTTQAILYETSNIIEVHTFTSTGTNSGVLGIQNTAGTAAYVAPGRNAVNWSVSTPDAYRFAPTALSYSWSPSTFLNSTTISNPVAGNVTSTIVYSLNVAASNGCNVSGTQTVSIDNPTVSISGPTLSCAGNSITLTGSGTPTFSWSTGSTSSSITDTPTITTTYSVVGTNTTTGCTASALQTVSVNALPAVAITGNSVICAGQTTTLTASGASTYTWNTSSTAVSITDNPVSNTTYSVTGTDANGCSNTAMQTVTVNSLPVITITGTTAVCDGVSANLTGNGATTYSWNTGATTAVIAVTPSVNTSYTVTGTDSNNCSDTASFMLTVNPNPTITVASGAICPGGSFTLAPTGASTYTFLPNGPVVSPGSTTTYSVSGTDALGCVSQTAATAVVTVTNNLSVTISGNTTVCFGQPASLTAGGASTYSWNTGASTSTIAPTPTTNTTYSVTGSSGTCSNTAVVTVTVNALPSVSLSASSTTACTNGSTIALTGSPSGGIYSGSNVTGSIFTPPSSSGTFTPSYSYTDAITGCSNNSNTSIIVSVCTDISKNTQGLTGLQVYPNPNLGEFTIELNNGTGKKVELSDLTGRIILTEVTNNDKINVNISNLANGVYFVKVQSNNSVEIVRIIKQ